jgi:single-stranded DNA-binding protein
MLASVGWWVPQLYRTWRDQSSGQQRSKHEVLCDRFQFLGEKPGTGTSESSRDPGSDDMPNNDIPF